MELLDCRWLQEMHDASGSAHPGRNKMLEVLRWQLYWPKMDADERCRLSSCTTWQWNRLLIRRRLAFYFRCMNQDGEKRQDLSMDFCIQLA
ncbi:uncharacterized protein VTP21DRAFT_8762 [Calcarisporiella thermophila]|uniref:uncharacterized protein n=1 Tax=Calcarisporiella thermophila TaxID=911321 RepID=UPI0037444F66